MATQIDTKQRDIALVEDAHIRPMMGNQVLESLPSRSVPSRPIKTPGTRTAGSTTCGTRFRAARAPVTALVRAVPWSARLEEGSLLKIRTGRRVWHAEGLGEDELKEGKAGTEMRGILFWVNLARKDKNVEPTAQVVQPNAVPVRHEGDATVRVLVGE